MSETKTNFKNELKSAASLILTFSLPILQHYHIHQNAPSGHLPRLLHSVWTLNTSSWWWWSSSSTRPSPSPLSWNSQYSSSLNDNWWLMSNYWNRARIYTFVDSHFAFQLQLFADLIDLILLRMTTKVLCPSVNNLGANYLWGCPSGFLSIMFCVLCFLCVPGFWLLHQHTHFCHSFVWNILKCSPASLLKSHPQSIGSVFLSLISLEAGLAQNSWSLPLTSLQITNR